jgi:uncharacterized repeat protein (TIGR03803 family)
MRCCPFFSFAVRPRWWPVAVLLFFLYTKNSAAQVYEKVFSFTDANAAVAGAGAVGTSPQGVILGTDGNFYGMTHGYIAGNNSFGTVFKMTQAGVVTTLVVFNGDNGSSPTGQLVQGSDGNFYGVTATGGANGDGVAFKVTSTGVFTKLVDFTGNGPSNRGSSPQGNFIQGNDGNFYGTTTTGGANGDGTVFRLTGAGILTTLVDFTASGSAADPYRGSGPAGGLFLSGDGNFYGTTISGGLSGKGTVFRLTPQGQMTVLVDFTGNSGAARGYYPQCSLIQGSDNNFYGTTSSGGANGDGTVFKMTPAGVLTTLVDFTGDGPTNRGSIPQAGLIQGSDGNFYGTTNQGGAASDGTVFKMTPSGVLTTLFDFPASYPYQLEYPTAGLIQGPDGNFFGTTQYGDTNFNSSGTVFEITADGNLTTVVNFSFFAPDSRGWIPYGVTQGADGNFYGVTRQGGNQDNGLSVGNGTVFQMTPAGVLTTLEEFDGGFVDCGSTPYAALVQAADGNFYGTTSQASGTLFGAAFQITPSGTLTKLTNLPSYGGNGRGPGPNASRFVQGADGNFYATTYLGGAYGYDNNGSGYGTVFKMTPAGALTDLVDFTDNGATNRGATPAAGLTVGGNGNFYGTTAGGGANGFGTVFMMTPAGLLTTLVDFTGTAGANRGASPQSELIQASDGNFYGTTAGGGANSFGTVFKMTPSGVLTTLVDFSGDGATNAGSGPNGIIQASDGNFYGTTAGGGSNNYGTIFQMTPAGVVTTLYDFATDPPDSNPNSALVKGIDGNLYGTTSGVSNSTISGNGAIFRLILPGAPLVYLNAPVTTTTSASLTFSAIARGSATSVTIQYGTDGVTFPNSIPVILNLNGFATTQLGRNLTNLPPGVAYFYQVVATNSYGTTTTPVATFATLAPPSAATTPVSALLSTSATFNGTVNAMGSSTTVLFQYGTDGNTFPVSIPATQSALAGSGDMSASASVAGLSAGATYYYRISATNAGGTTISGVSSFTTPGTPVAAIGAATFVSSTSATLNGTVNANVGSAAGGSATVQFQYTLDSTFNSGINTATVAQTVSGNVATPVSVTVSSDRNGQPLEQGKTYYYRILATAFGLTGTSTSATFTLDILSGVSQQFPDGAAGAQGVLLVTMTPATGVTTGWRLAGEQAWRSSGTPALGLVTGNFTVQFRPVPGYIQPADEVVAVTSGGAAALIQGDYSPASGGATGGLTVFLTPSNLSGKGWRFVGESAWRASGATVSNLVPGTYLVECEPVSNETTPATAAIAVPSGAPLSVTLVYTAEVTQPGQGEAPLSFAQINADPTQAFAYVGQLRSDVGLASGFVVEDNVVLTAAHVVFDPSSYEDAGGPHNVTGLQWVFQRTAGVYEPVPQIPQGAAVFTKYSAERAADNNPGAESVASQNLDAAALYFLAPAGRNGYGGYLASAANVNEYLTSSTRHKLLIGYPVDGIAASQQGDMFVTGTVGAGGVTTPVPVTAAMSLEVVGTDGSGDPLEQGSSGALSYQVYTTTSFSGVGGNSGGPVCVQYDDGNYYPAGIYLGGSGEAVVRAIDQPVVDLIENAVALAANGTPPHLGGGNQMIGSGQGGGAPTTGSILVTFATSAGDSGAASATWSTSPDPMATQHSGGVAVGGYSPNTYTLFFSPVSGYTTPANQQITVAAGNTPATATATYTASGGGGGSNAPVITSATTLTVFPTSTIAYQITATNSPTSFGASLLGGGALPKGLTLSKTGMLAGKLAAGNYTLQLSATNAASLTGTATLTITVVSSPAPVIATTAAGGLGPHAATLAGTVNPESGDTSVFFQYGLTTAYELPPTVSVDKGAGSSTVSFTAPISGLALGTTYHYRAVAVKSGISVYGKDLTFTTLGPGFGTTSQAYLAASGAQVSFSVNPNGVATTVQFMYGTSAGTYTLGETAPQSIGSGKVPVNVLAFLSGLQANTTYHFIVVITSSAGTFQSVDQTFTTLGFDTTEVKSTTGGDKALGNPALSGTQFVAYGATLPSGLFDIETDNNGTTQVLAQSGTMAGNAAGANSPFASFSDPIVNANANVAFRATLASKTTGIWANLGGALALLAAQGAPAPTTGGTFGAFTALGLSDTAGVVFLATVAGGSTTSGIWEGTSNGGLALKLSVGETVNGKAITALTFLPAGELYVNGQTRGFNGSGHLISAVTYGKTGTGLVSVLGGTTPHAVATSGVDRDPVSNLAYASFGNPAINANDHTAFAATLTAAAAGTTTGIWADDSSGTRQLIARAGTTAPGGSATFLAFSDPVYNNNEAVAFRATLKAAAGQSALGLWATDANAPTLAKVALAGDQAPGCPTGTTFSAFSELALPDTGGVIFLATLTGSGVTTANNTGIFAVDTTGNLQLIVRTGDVLNNKTVTALSFLPPEPLSPQTRSFDPATASLVFSATLTDPTNIKSTAIFNVTFP